jgi:predicted extracellular nuclease
MKRVFLLVVIALFATTAQAQMRITEWMYDGSIGTTNPKGEFIEFTNVGASAIDMTGWSFDDDSRTPTISLSTFGTVAAGESVILTDATAADFRSVWGLLDSVKVIGDNSANLGRNDEINLFDGSGVLADRLTYNDQGTDTVKGPRTQHVSANITWAALSANNASLAVKSVVGDTYLSYQAGADIGNPGVYTPYVATPEPGTFALIAVAAGAFFALRRRWL